jgi:hypothetical protein
LPHERRSPPPSSIPDDLRGLRDRALLLTGFAGVLRRPELAAMRAEQLEKNHGGPGVPPDLAAPAGAG